jgi:hypothetical protein
MALIAVLTRVRFGGRRTNFRDYDARTPTP